MLDIQKIMLALNKLEGKVSAARLPSDKKNLVDCFAPLFNALITRYKSAKNESTQRLHFAAIYGIVRIHSEQIREKLVCYQSNSLYLRSFIETDASQDYHKALLDFLSTLENDFQQYRRSDEAAKYIVYTEAPIGSPYDPNFHLGFSFGTEMANENTEAISEARATSLEQLEKRIFAYTYFEMYELEVKSTLVTRTGASLATNLAAAIFAPITLPVTLTGAVYYSGYLGPKTWDRKIALERSAIRRYEITAWRHEICDILSNPRKSNPAYCRATSFASVF